MVVLGVDFKNFKKGFRMDLKKYYWKKNIQYVTMLLSIWFMVSYGFGIILVDYLDQYRFWGFKLGFWFAQQGSIYVFLILIFVYVYLMNKLEKNVNSGEVGR